MNTGFAENVGVERIMHSSLTLDDVVDIANF